MANAAIEIDDVTKIFKLYREKAKSAKERVIRAGRNPYTPFYALRDISLEIAEGETLALLGHNGSGKSTLLKCVAGILRPTTGPDHHPGPAGRAARARRRLPPRPHRAGERLPERVDPRVLRRRRSSASSTTSSSSPSCRSSSTCR